MHKPVKRTPEQPSASPAAGKQLVDRGKRVLALEAAAIERLADTLGPAFARAVEILAGAKGRVIVSGVGKSGLIARKIRKSSSVKSAAAVGPSSASPSSLCGRKPISSFSVSSISNPASRKRSMAAATVADCCTDSLMAVPTSSASRFVSSSISTVRC